jgi:hypothetical protein
MPEAAVVALLIAFPALGAATRHWLVVLLPLLAWPLFYLGLNNEWWGYGTGEGWQTVAASFTAIGTLTTALGVWLGRATRKPSRLPPPRPDRPHSQRNLPRRSKS